MGFAHGLTDYIIRITMTIPNTDPETAARLTHFSSRSRLVHGNLLLSPQPRGESPPPSMSSNPLAVEGCSFQKRGHSPQIDHLCSQVCLVVLSRPGSNLIHAFCAQLLQSQQSRIQVTRATYTTSRGHCPSSRRVRLTNHVECQPKFHHSTEKKKPLKKKTL